MWPAHLRSLLQPRRRLVEACGTSSLTRDPTRAPALGVAVLATRPLGKSWKPFSPNLHFFYRDV